MITFSSKPFNSHIKVFVPFFLLLFSYTSSFSQSCDCAQPPSCAPCSGGMSSITFEYTGPGVGFRYSVFDGSGNLTNGFLINNKFIVNSRQSGQTFRDDFINVRILVLGGGGIVTEETIETSCATPIFRGDTFGDLLVLAGESVDGGSICCNVENADDVAPVITSCPVDINLSLISGCEVSATWEAPDVTDNCAVTSFTSTYNSGDPFPIGTTAVTYTARDAAGNESTCTFNINVNDGINPEFSSCNKSKIKVETDGACSATVNWTEPVAVDNCSLTSLTSNYSPGDEFPQGKTTVTYIATDESGNTATCSFDVQVKVKGSEAISGCLDDMVIVAAADCNTVVNWDEPVSNCTLNLSSNYSPGDNFPIGETEVIYIASDADGEVGRCSFVVNVIDETAPVISQCPANITLFKNPDCDAVAEWQPPSVSDNCDLEIVLEASHESGTTFPVGVTEVSYIATDNFGLTSTCNFTVTVTEVPYLFIKCPNDQTILGNENCEAAVSWDPPVLRNLCVNAELSSNYNSGDVFPLGTTEIIYTATDEEGFSTTCSFNVVVKPGESPKFEDCPSAITVRADSFGNAIVNWNPPQAEVNCNRAELSSTHQSGDSFTVGTTEVQYTLSSDFNQDVVCSFIVTVLEEEFKLNVQKLVTPNNDGYNDRWELKDISRFDRINVIILDKWGSEVFKVTGTKNGSVIWDGTYKGNNAPTGTYYYIISLKSSASSVEESGFLELIN